MNRYYVDAGTQHNGLKGYQLTKVCVMNENEEVLIEKTIGDFTINEGEAIAICYCLEMIEPGVPKEIFSDSQTAIGWVIQGLPKKNTRLSERHRQIVELTHKFLKETKSSLSWIPREHNKAGWYLDKHKPAFIPVPYTEKESIQRLKRRDEKQPTPFERILAGIGL